MNAWLKRKLTGLTISQEYVCIGSEKLISPLNIFLTTKKFSNGYHLANHIFLGYKPLIIAVIFPLATENDFDDDEVCFSFSEAEAQFSTLVTWKGFPTDRNSLARLRMKKVNSREFTANQLVFYQGSFGQHRFISSFNQIVNSFLLNRIKKPIGNISLNGNLYDQVRIAYSIARKISLITVMENEFINIFPTDLHGAIANDFYMISLRIEGQACQQVEATKKIVISEIDSSQFMVAYKLGKNHMKKMTNKETFDLSNTRSDFFQFPLPTGVSLYRELELIDSWDLGIHRLFTFKVINARKTNNINPLTHVHQYYAQWRQNNKLDTRYLFR